MHLAYIETADTFFLTDGNLSLLADHITDNVVLLYQSSMKCLAGSLIWQIIIANMQIDTKLEKHYKKYIEN